MKDYLRLIGYVKTHIWLLFIATVLMMFSSILQPISLTALIPFIDKVLTGKEIIIPNANIPPLITDFIYRLNKTPAAKLLGAFLLFYMIIFILRSLLSYYQQYLMREVSQRVVRDLRNIIYNKLLELSMDFYSYSKTGTLVSRITYDTTIIQDAVSEGLTDLIFQSFLFIFSVITIIFVSVTFRIKPIFLFVVFFIMPLIVIPLVRIGRRLRHISKKSQESMADINNTLYESISGIRIVKGFCMEEYEKDKFRMDNQRFKNMVMKSNKRILAISPISELINLVGAVTIIWFGGRQVISGALSLGTLTAFCLSVIALARPVNRLSRVHNVNQQALAAASRMFELLDTEPSIKERPDSVELPKIKDSISFSEVSFRYDKEEVLTDISFQAKAGSIVAFVGPSGAGKTTLVNLLPRFYDPTEGSVRVDGLDIKDVKIGSLRNQIGIVTQETILFNDTVAVNISYGTNIKDMNALIEAAKTANAHDFIMNMPEKYNTIIGERGFRLSGGEKQRLAIARAVFKNPPILIFDEATSQLDSESERLVQEAIDRLMKGRTVFVIAHRLSTIKHADKIIVMDKGRIMGIGTHKELIEKGGLYKKLYNLQLANL